MTVSETGVSFQWCSDFNGNYAKFNQRVKGKNERLVRATPVIPGIIVKLGKETFKLLDFDGSTMKFFRYQKKKELLLQNAL